MEDSRDQRGRFAKGGSYTANRTNQRNVRFDKALIWAIDRIVLARGTTRSVEIIRYATRALQAPKQPPVGKWRPSQGKLPPTTRGTAGYLETDVFRAISVYTTDEFWDRIVGRTARTGESPSEALRALVYHGLASHRPSDKVLKIDPVERALSVLRDGIELDLATLDALVWPGQDRDLPHRPRRPQGGRGLHAARVLVKLLEERQILVPQQKVVPVYGVTGPRRDHKIRGYKTVTVWVVNKGPGAAVLVG